jgi:hypothetical protein
LASYLSALQSFAPRHKRDRGDLSPSRNDEKCAWKLRILRRRFRPKIPRVKHLRGMRAELRLNVGRSVSWKFLRSHTRGDRQNIRRLYVGLIIGRIYSYIFIFEYDLTLICCFHFRL